MKNVFKKKLCVTVCTFLLVLSSSFSYGNNAKQNFGLTEEAMKAVFNLVDIDDNGFITANEYKTFLFGKF
jgi:Ca2+-binding EF-hand superfamily protein